VTDNGPGAPQPPYDDRPQASRRGLKVLVLTVVLTLLVGGGAFAFFVVDPFHLFRSGPQPAEAFPADAVFYAGVDLDPKASQKVDALRFLNHFPSFRDNAGLTDANADIADRVIGKAMADLDCPGVTYQDDVKPWLGERFGLAVMPRSGQDKEPVAFAIQVSDEDAARKGIEALNSCDVPLDPTSDGSPMGIAFVHGYLLLAETQAQADAYAKSANEHSLADDADFKADLDSLGDLGVATTWVDVAGIVDTFADEIPLGSGLGEVGASLPRVAATFRFASDHIEIATSIHGKVSAVDEDPNPVVKLPDSTVFAMSESGGGQRLADTWQRSIDELRKREPSIDDEIDQFQAETGLRIPTDLETVLGRNLMVALDKQGLSADALEQGGLPALNLGVRFTNDPAKLDALYAKISDLIRSSTGSDSPLVKKDFDDGIAIATNAHYAEEIGALEGDLGDSDAFRSVVPDGTGQEFVAFLNFDAIKPLILQQMREDSESADTIANVQPVKAFGITVDVDGDYAHFTMRMSVDD
jgi:hypothetical protein